MSEGGAPTRNSGDAVLHLELPLDAPMKGVIQAERTFLSVIVDVGREVTERKGSPVRWLLAHANTNGMIRLRLRAVPDRDDVPAALLPDVADAIVEGFSMIEREAVRPPHFTDSALEHVRELADLVRDLGPVKVVNGVRSAPVTREAAEHVQRLLGASYDSYGSVDGRLDAVNLHERWTFYVYDSMTGRRIRCEFGQRISVDHIARALTRRVVAYGRVNYRADGEIASVLVDNLEVIPDPSELPTADDVRGILGS